MLKMSKCGLLTADGPPWSKLTQSNSLKISRSLYHFKLSQESSRVDYTSLRRVYSSRLATYRDRLLVESRWQAFRMGDRLKAWLSNICADTRFLALLMSTLTCPGYHTIATPIGCNGFPGSVGLNIIDGQAANPKAGRKRLLTR